MCNTHRSCRSCRSCRSRNTRSRDHAAHFYTRATSAAARRLARLLVCRRSRSRVVAAAAAQRASPPQKKNAAPRRADGGGRNRASIFCFAAIRCVAESLERARSTAIENRQCCKCQSDRQLQSTHLHVRRVAAAARLARFQTSRRRLSASRRRALLIGTRPDARASERAHDKTTGSYATLAGRLVDARSNVCATAHRRARVCDKLRISRVAAAAASGAGFMSLRAQRARAAPIVTATKEQKKYFRTLVYCRALMNRSWRLSAICDRCGARLIAVPN